MQELLCAFSVLPYRPRLVNMPAVLQIVLLKIFRCVVCVHFYTYIVYNFTKFKSAENCTSQDHFSM